jgi:hypothetical protein
MVEDKEDQEQCYSDIYEVFKDTKAPLSVDLLHQSILADSSRCGDCLSLFVQYGNSSNGTLRLVCGFQSYMESTGPQP